MPPAHRSRDNESRITDSPGLELRRVRDRELQLKRITGEISCAECRRLKLKCDKKVPCSSCTRRGCKHICPTGVNKDAASRTARSGGSDGHIPSVEDSTSQKLRAMSDRIRMLEDALQIECGQKHPLLTPELLAVKQGIVTSNNMYDEDSDTEEMRGSFGVLSVDENKSMRFLGATAVEQSLLMDVYDPVAHALKRNSTLVSLPHEILQASNMWPFTPMYLSNEAHAIQLATFLPSYQRASALIEAFFGNLSWFMSSVERSHVQGELMTMLYKDFKPVPADSMKLCHMHDLALLYSVFSNGSVADLTQPTAGSEGLRYNQLTRAALGIHPVIEYASLSAIQALIMMATYSIYLCDKNFHETSYKTLSLAVMLSSTFPIRPYQIGLHRDPARWKLDPRMVQRRRRVFWELFGHDQWKSIMTGRPPHFTSQMADCEYPNDNGATIDEDGTTVESVWHWKYRFSREVLSPLAVKLCGARPLKYSEVMELDRLIQNFKVHPYTQKTSNTDSADITGEFIYLHPYVSIWWRDGTSHSLHRNYFARALLEYPNDPMGSPFAPSFLTTYKTALTLIKIAQGAQKAAPLIMLRMWIVWSRALACSIVVALVAIKGSAVSFAHEAFLELKRTLELFEKVVHHPIIKHGIVIIRRLYKRAAAIHENQHEDLNSQDSSPDSDGQSPSLPIIRGELDDADEELLLLRGTTRFVQQRFADLSPSIPLPFTVPENPILNHLDNLLPIMDTTFQQTSGRTYSLEPRTSRNDDLNIGTTGSPESMNLVDFLNTKAGRRDKRPASGPIPKHADQTQSTTGQMDSLFSQAGFWLTEADQSQLAALNSNEQHQAYFDEATRYSLLQNNNQPYQEQSWGQDPPLQRNSRSPPSENGILDLNLDAFNDLGLGSSPYEVPREVENSNQPLAAQDSPPEASFASVNLNSASLFQMDESATDAAWRSLLQQSGIQNGGFGTANWTNLMQ